MSKEMGIIILGLWIAVVPYLGIPSSWRTAVLVLSGLGVAVIGFLMRGETLSGIVRTGRLPFVENSGPKSRSHERPEGSAPIQ